MRVPILILLISVFISAVATGQPVKVQPSSVAASAEIVTNEIFRRTPSIDGIITPGEWDLFMSSSDVVLTIYANWDSNNFYVAFQADVIDSVELSFDLNNDGFYHNNDNLWITISNLEEGQTPEIKAQLYDSKSAKDKNETGFSAITLTGIVVKTGSSENGKVIELALPSEALKGFKIRPKTKFGLRAAARSSGKVHPAGEPGSVHSCTLVETKVSVPENMDLSLEILDKKVTPGQELNARVIFRNKGKDNIPASYFVIGGEGRAAKLMDSEKRMLQSALKPNQRVKHNYNAVILPHLTVGSWAVGVELRDANDSRIAAGLAAFEVVEPFVFTVRSTPDLRKHGIAETRAKVFLEVFNNTNRTVFGKVKFAPPTNWKVSPRYEVREFAIRGEDQSAVLQYELLIPNSETPGEYILNFDVQIGAYNYPVVYRMAFPIDTEAKKQPKSTKTAEP